MSKVVFVTGSASGMGKSIARFFSSKGFTLVWDQPKSRAFFSCERLSVAEVGADAPRPYPRRCESDHRRIGVHRYFEEPCGGGLVGPVEELLVDEIRRVFQVNVYGASI